MKTLHLSFILALLLHQNLLAEGIFENNQSLEQNQSSNAKDYNSLIEHKASEKDLNYLFNETKFPVDDYIYRGGFKQPTQDVYNAFKGLDNNDKEEDYQKIKDEDEKEFRKKIQEELLKKSGVKKGDPFSS